LFSVLSSTLLWRWLSVWQCCFWKDCANLSKLYFCFGVVQSKINCTAVPIVRIWRVCIVLVGRAPYILQTGLPITRSVKAISHLCWDTANNSWSVPWVTRWFMSAQVTGWQGK
jgi:hypothetical protein